MGKTEENLAYFNTGAWLHQEYKGIRILKYPSDLDHYKQILVETKPDLIIETGTLDGASALFFRDNSNAEVFSIEKDDRSIKFSKTERLHFIYADSLDVDVDITGAKRVMVVLDSDHSKDHVLAELKLYAPLVSKGCYLVVEDTFISQYLHNDDANNDYSDGSSWEALQDWGANGFKTMPEPELTMNPGGWLKKL